MAEPPSAAPRQPAAGYAMVSIPYAQKAALDAVPGPLPPVVVPLQQALGRVMAEDLVATSPLPPFAASIKDGYAVRSRELADAASKSPGKDGEGSALVFPVAFEALAGASSPPLPPNSVAYISTGAPLPEGADAVVQIEDTELVEDGGGEGEGEGEGEAARGRGARRPRSSVLFRSLREGKTRAPRPGEDVRAPGSDLSPGAVVLAKGERVGPAEVGLALSSDQTSLPVRPSSARSTPVWHIEGAVPPVVAVWQFEPLGAPAKSLRCRRKQFTVLPRMRWMKKPLRKFLKSKDVRQIIPSSSTSREMKWRAIA